MLLFVVLFAFFIYYSLKARRSVATVLLAYYVLSLIGAYILSPSRFLMDIDPINLLYLVFSLLSIIICWRHFKFNRAINIKLTHYDRKILKYFLFIGFLLFIINLITIIYLGGVVDDYSEFKNGGEAASYFAKVPLPHILLLLSAYLSPVSILILSYHFYYLTVGNLKFSIYTFIVSSNFALIGITVFSRSNVAVYALTYFVLFLLYRKYIHHSLKKKYFIIISAAGCLVAAALLVITINRFVGDGISLYTAKSFMLDDTIVDDPVLVSQISYFSQWYMNGTKYLSNYDGQILLNWSFPLFNTFADKLFGLEEFSNDVLQNHLRRIFKSEYGNFLGISTNILYSMGYLIATLFFMSYYICVAHIKRREMSILGMMLVIALLSVPLSGIFNSALNSSNIHLMIISIVALKITKNISYK